MGKTRFSWRVTMVRLASSPCASEYAVKSTMSVNITTTSMRRADWSVLVVSIRSRS